MTKDNGVRERIKKGLALIAITYKVGVEDLIKAKTMTCDIPVGTRLKGLVSFELDDLEAFILEEVQRGKEEERERIAEMILAIAHRYTEEEIIKMTKHQKTLAWEHNGRLNNLLGHIKSLSPEGKETKV